MPGQRPQAGGLAAAGLAAIASAASAEAGDVPAALLGDYLPAVVDAAATGRRLSGAELAGYSRSGEQAAQHGVALRDLVDLYLSATWRLWRELTAGGATELRDAGLAVLRAADDAVAAAAEGFERSRIAVARQEEAQRLSFFDDLMSGRGTAAEIISRGERYGLQLTGPHLVLLAGPADPAGTVVAEPPVRAAAQVISAAAAPAESLVAGREGRVAVLLGSAGDAASRAARALAAQLAPAGPRQPDWRVAIGRPHSGPAGVRASYQEAVEALQVAGRLGLPDRVVDAGAVQLYRLLLRDRTAIAELVGELLAPLLSARNGAEPLLATLEAYYAAGAIAAEAARKLHLSVRAVTYRLARIRELTGHDPADPAQALTLQVAVIGARLLDWPATPLPAS